jgi:hypothetical protein
MRQSRRGLTVPEATVATFVLVLMVSGLLGLLRMCGFEFWRNNAKMTADDSASLAMQALAADMRDGLTATTAMGGQELYVVIPSKNSQGDYDRFSVGGTYRYYLSGTSLYRTLNGGTAKLLGRNLDKISFTVNANRVDVQVTTRKKGGIEKMTTVLSSQIMLRNTPPEYS